uniref:Putative 37 kDa protein n=1 Tax=Mirafiori lettuce big-vein virus TaxID=200255 RepID=A0A678TMD3_9VIRU|nr:MAG: putative 37 kDa protein [Mirafiori lettuce big-vein virus]
MGSFADWMRLIDPILSRAIAIIPHLKEIINIAFKPFNGIDALDDHDHKHLKNRILHIDEKLYYNERKPVRSYVLDSENRSNIITGYNEKMKSLEESVVKEVIYPILMHLSSQRETLIRMEEIPFLSHFDREMKHSFLLPEKEFFIQPVKKILINNLEKGLSYLLDMHPRRNDLNQNRAEYYQRIYSRGFNQESYGSPMLKNNKALELISYSTYIWNKIGLREDLFLIQFYETGFKSTYMACFPRACSSYLAKRQDSKSLEMVFNTLIVESGFIIRVAQSLSFFDNSLSDYFYPRMPLDREIVRIKTRERENFDHWSN